MDSRAEFDLRRFGTVPRFNKEMLEENHHGQYAEENPNKPLTLIDSGGDIPPPEDIDPNRTYTCINLTDVNRSEPDADLLTKNFSFFAKYICKGN